MIVKLYLGGKKHFPFYYGDIYITVHIIFDTHRKYNFIKIVVQHSFIDVTKCTQVYNYVIQAFHHD